jgi:hypothetical protein
VSADAAHQAFVDQTNTSIPSAAAANKSHKLALSAISGMLTWRLEKETVFFPQKLAMMVITGALPSVAASGLSNHARTVNSGMCSLTHASLKTPIPLAMKATTGMSLKTIAC